MKKMLALFLTMLLLVGCSPDSEYKDIQEDENAAVLENETGVNGDKSDIMDSNLSVTDTEIETAWFSLTVPDDWIGNFSCQEFQDNDRGIYTLKIGMNTAKYPEPAHLFSIEMYPMSDKEYISITLEGDWQSPIGIMTMDDGSGYFVSSYPASEAACADNELDRFIRMADSVNDCLSTFTPKNSEQFVVWTDSMLEEQFSETTATVPYAINIIGYDFETFKKQQGGSFRDLTNVELLASALLKPADDVAYYRQDNFFVGVEDGNLVAMAYGWSTSPTVREAINAENLTELFSVKPEILSVDGQAVFFYLWKCDNGYIGIRAVGSSDPERIYDNWAEAFVVFSDKKLCSLFGS